MRTRPYTAIGLKRQFCCRCKLSKATDQWAVNACATGNKQVWVAVCARCDVDFNEATLRFIDHPDTDELMERYRREKKVKTSEDYKTEGRCAFKNAGQAAYGAATRNKLNPYYARVVPGESPDAGYYWATGWDQALARKINCFTSYRKDRTLFDQKYAPPAARSSPGMLEHFQETRKKRMDRLVSEYPDFPAAYERSMVAKQRA